LKNTGFLNDIGFWLLHRKLDSWFFIGSISKSKRYTKDIPPKIRTQQLQTLLKIIALFSLVPPKYNYLVCHYTLKALTLKRLYQTAPPTYKSVFLFLSNGSTLYALFLSYAKSFDTIAFIAILLGFNLGTIAYKVQ
jgi:hypothetical protein